MHMRKVLQFLVLVAAATLSVAAPAGYDKVKQRGDDWLKQHGLAKRPKDLWSPFLKHLADGFSLTCADMPPCSIRPAVRLIIISAG